MGVTGSLELRLLVGRWVLKWCGRASLAGSLVNWAALVEVDLDVYLLLVDMYVLAGA